MLKILTAALCAATCLTHAGNAASFKSIKKGYALEMTGRILNGDQSKLGAAYSTSCSKYNRCPERIFLNSEGGFVVGAIDVGLLVYSLGLDTVVRSGDICASACFYVFAKGRHRVMREGGYLGVHRTYDGVTGKEDTRVNIDLADMLAGWGVPQKIIIKMMATSSDEMAWLMGDDAGNWIETLQ